MSDVTKKFKKGLFWSVGGEFSYLIISFVVNVVLARLLSPAEFGVMAIAYFFISISTVLTESGLSGALIRKSNATEVDNSTIFIFNLAVSLFLYIVLFFTSDLIEQFYEISNLSLYLKVLGLILIINAFRIIQQVKLVKELDYKTITTFKLISVILSSIIAITMALIGYGIWALIAMQGINAFLTALLYWITQGSLKTYSFSKKSFKELYSFGLFTTLSSILDTAFDNVYQLILGKYFSLNQTGFYYQAKKLTEVSVSVIKSTTAGVVFATLSKIQDDKDKFDKMYSNIIRVFTVVIGLICLLIFIYAREILYIIYGEKWLSADFYMKILAVAYFFYMQEMFNRNIFKVFNKTHKIFILELIKKAIIFVSLVIGIYQKSIEVLMYGYMITYIISYYINYYVSRTVYKSTSTFHEMNFTLKTIGVSISIGLILEFVNKQVALDFLYNLLYLPLVIGLYIILLSFLKVVNLQKDFKFIVNFKK